MKKIIFVLFFITLGVLLMKDEEEIFIPKDAIRFRVIANSNSVEDQMKKSIIKDQVEEKVYELIQDGNNVSEVRNLIQNNLDTIEEIIKDYKVPYQISYGNNYFPAKTYQNIIYPAGNYESLVITLGKGTGNNFWCVLFPPLCLLENTKEDISDIEYEFYVKKLLEKF